MGQLQHIETAYQSLVFRIIVDFLFFNHLGESIFDPPRIFEICNTVNQHNKKKNHFLSMILLTSFDISVKKN